MRSARFDKLSDLELVEICNSGWRDDAVEAFGLLYRRHRDYVTRVALRFCSDREIVADTLQETFVYLLRKFPPSGEGLILTARLRSLLYPVARNLTLTAIKRRRRDEGSSGFDPDQLPDPRSVDPQQENLEKVMASLLEFLAEFRMSIPELGEVAAVEPPIVVLTSNRTREVHDALKRRCLYCWVDYPTQDAEERILAARVPGLPDALRARVTGFVQALRKEGLFKAPGVSETLDWAEALMAMEAQDVDVQAVSNTLGALLKYQEDLETLDEGKVERLLAASA